MHFFEKYDFFNFSTFNMNFSAIFDELFLLENRTNTASVTPHSHETWELYFVKSGNITVDYGSQLLSLGNCQVAIIPPDIEHLVKECSDNASFGSVRFCFSCNENDKIALTISDMINKTTLVPISCDPNMVSEFDKLRQVYKSYVENPPQKLWIYPKMTAQSIIFFSSVLETMAYVENPIKSSNFTAKKDISSMIIEFFMLYASDDSVTINDLAENLSYSVSQTNRILNQKFGMSFRTLMKETRIKKAKYYLTRTDFSIHKISEILGFKETKNFNKSFKASVGITPTAYRKNQQYQS